MTASLPREAPLRVVQLVNSDGFGGVERFVARLGPALAARGAQVTVVGGEPGAMTAALSSSGVRFLPAATRREAARALAEAGPADVVDAHMTDAELVAALAPRQRRGAFVATRHFGARRGGSPAGRLAAVLIRRRLDAQIAVSRFVAEAVDGAAEVIPPGVEDAEGRADRDRTVLVAQRLEPEKDTATAVRAWAASRARHDGWQMVVAGDGAQRPSLERLAGDLGVAGTVRFLGHRDDAPELMAAAGMVIAPTPREGLGLSVVEAMARATPVVASAAGGHLETVGSVDPDSLFPPGDAGAAAGRIDAMAHDADRRRRVGSALQAAQRRSFSLESQARRTLEVYRRAGRA